MGFLAWDKRTGEIIYSLPTPYGHVGDYDWDYVFYKNPDYPEFICTSNEGPELTTLEAKRLFRVVDGEMIRKPVPHLKIGQVFEGVECDVELDFDHLLEGEHISDIKATITGDKLQPVETLLQVGSNIFIFDILGELQINITDYRVQSITEKFEVVPK